MARRPLGCMTGTALIATMLAVLGVTAAATATENGIFSPGALNAEVGTEEHGGVRAHADLTGECAACHPAFWTGMRMGDRCLACHTEVQEEIETESGLHTGFATPANCRVCHTDHRGSAGALTRETLPGFPHERTGYVLWAHDLRTEGGTFGCVDCHPDSLRTFEAQTCTNCHMDLDPGYVVQHRATFGERCVVCHDGVDTYGHAFDHAQGGFLLEGRHAEIECVYCHAGATTLEVLRETPSACIACHEKEDIHLGRLGVDCGECHDPQGWDSAEIDHGRTRFTLTGGHLAAACEDCHVDRQWTGIPMSCTGCHVEDDAHAGQFEEDCSSCHTTAGWDDLAFDHARTGFLLEFGHGDVTCAECHPGGRYVGTPTDCAGCHLAEDAHAGRFGTACDACHQPTTWQDATFDHDLSRFRLTGAHTRAACESCHRGGQFSGTPTSCGACHNRPSSHGSAFGGSCGECHSTSAWRPASFNGPHPFPMNHEGAGGNCGLCHPSSLTSYSCSSCHSTGEMNDKHKEIGGYSGSCTNCHPAGEKEEGDD